MPNDQGHGQVPQQAGPRQLRPGDGVALRACLGAAAGEVDGAAVQAQGEAGEDVQEEGRDDEEWLREWVGLVVGPGKEEVAG